MVDAAFALGVGAETELLFGGAGVGIETVAGRRGGCETATAAMMSDREVVILADRGVLLARGFQVCASAGILVSNRPT